MGGQVQEGTHALQIANYCNYIVPVSVRKLINEKIILLYLANLLIILTLRSNYFQNDILMFV